MAKKSFYKLLRKYNKLAEKTHQNFKVQKGAQFCRNAKQSCGPVLVWMKSDYDRKCVSAVSLISFY